MVTTPSRLAAPIRDLPPWPPTSTASSQLIGPRQPSTIDRSTGWTVGPATIQSLGAASPLVGRELPGLVLLTIAAGRLAWEATEA